VTARCCGFARQARMVGPNAFGGTLPCLARVVVRMSQQDDGSAFGRLAAAGVPTDREREHLDVADLPPPKPLTETLERLADLPDDAVLVQSNDRVPQHLFPKLEDRGFEHESIETDDGVLTAIWTPT
jgi:hypothetical protein